jgi:hypothetical protein
VLNGPDSLRAVIEAARGEPGCTAEGQCRAIAFGAKPCGGPWSYLVYSTATADTLRLAEAVAAYNRREADLNREQNRSSDCLFVSPPQVACAGGFCRTVP